MGSESRGRGSKRGQKGHEPDAVDRVRENSATWFCSTRIDWQLARAELRTRLTRLLSPSERIELDDLTQIALVRLHRLITREESRDPEATLNMIARRVWIDYLRMKKRREAMQRAWSFEMRSAGARSPAAPGEDSLERVRFMVFEFFHSHGALCLDLARHYFEESSWEAVAKLEGRTPEAVRKQWSRCLALLREQAGETDLLLAWEAMHDEEERS